jgi:hypothetical protein
MTLIRRPQMHKPSWHRVAKRLSKWEDLSLWTVLFSSAVGEVGSAINSNKANQEMCPSPWLKWFSCLEEMAPLWLVVFMVASKSTVIPWQYGRSDTLPRESPNWISCGRDNGLSQRQKAR